MGNILTRQVLSSKDEVFLINSFAVMGYVKENINLPIRLQLIAR